MKLQTAFKLSALAAALTISSTSFALTINDDVEVSGDAIVEGSILVVGDNLVAGDILVDGVVETSTINLGNSTSSKYVPGSVDPVNKPVQQFIATNGDVFYKIEDGLGNNSEGDPTLASNYTVTTTPTGNVLTKYEGSTADATFNLGGTAADLTTGNFEEDDTTKELNDQNLTYSSSVKKTPSVQTDLSVTEADGTTTSIIDAALQSGDYSLEKESIVTGIQADGTYAVNVSKENAKYDASGAYKSGEVENSNLKSDGLTVTSKTTDADGEPVNQTTTLKADGITTTGTVSAGKITLGGKDLQETLDAEAKIRAEEDAAIRTEFAEEDKAIRTELAAGDEATLANAKAHADAGLNVAADDRAAIRTEFAEGDKATLTAAQNFAKAEDAKTLDQAKKSADAGDVATLASANAFTENAVSGVNNRVNQLNSRISDVEKSAYRGVAIALAAQQQIPNIGAGQFAVFGGVGHYEGESAGALGVASVFADGRTSVSAAIGIAGSDAVGGRVGVSYVFGGK